MNEYQANMLPFMMFEQLGTGALQSFFGEEVGMGFGLSIFGDKASQAFSGGDWDKAKELTRFTGSGATSVLGMYGGTNSLAGASSNTLRGAAKTPRMVEQYALQAEKSGFYPNMVRGFKDPQGLVWLNEGEAWKFGISVNGPTRYSRSALKQLGVVYRREFTGTLNEALALERMKILNRIHQTGHLPPGNKIIR